MGGAGVGGADAKGDGRAVVKMPNLGRIDAVPMADLSGFEQEQNGGARGTLTGGSLGAPRLAVMAALRMRLQIEGFDHGVGGGHGRDFQGLARVLEFKPLSAPVSTAPCGVSRTADPDSALLAC